jgi:short-subunit dehydrogenase
MKNKRVLITGSSQGLGLEIAKFFISKKLIVFLHGKNEKKLKFLSEKLNCNYINCDLNYPDKSIPKLIDFIKEYDVSILINNAGVLNKDPKEMVIVNLLSGILLIQEFYNYRKFKGGKIVSINSLAGITPNFNEAVYCATKFGMTGFIQSLQEKSLEQSIKIHEFCFGALKTNMSKNKSDHKSFINPKEAARFIYNSISDFSSLYSPLQIIKRTNYE